MPSRRTLKAAEAIREVVSMAILREIKDPRVRNVTVTAVEVSPDMKQARVHVSVMGSDTQQHLSLRGLQSAAGFLQAKVAERIETRYTPRLAFELDQGVKRSIEVARQLREMLPPQAASVDETSVDGASVDETKVDEQDEESAEGAVLADTNDAGADDAVHVEADVGEDDSHGPPRPR